MDDPRQTRRRLTHTQRHHCVADHHYVDLRPMENIRAFPFAPRQSQVSMQRWRATSPCPKAKSKPRVLPLGTNAPASAPTSPKGTITAAKARAKATCACYWTNGPPSAPTASQTTTYTEGARKVTVGDHHLNPRWKKSHVRFLLNQWPDQRPRSIGDHYLKPKVEEESRALPLEPVDPTSTPAVSESITSIEGGRKVACASF
ncbi:hypothetical protein MTO96_021862 [Rhipicephalus appendiculatus]